MKNQISPKSLRALAAATFLALSAMAVAALDAPTTTSAPAAGNVSPAAPQLSFGVPDVLKLSNAKVSDDTIVSYIQYSGRSYGALNAAEIVYLHEQGVSDRVVTAMLEQRRKWTDTAAPATQAAAPANPAPPAQTVAPPATTYVQPAPASTVYVIPNSPRYVNYGYSYPSYAYYPSYGYYGYYSYPALSFSLGYYGGYRGGYYCGSGYRGGVYYGGGYHGGGHYSGGHNYAGSGYHGGGGGGHHR